MTPKEKADELFSFYWQCGDCPKDWAKINAIKVADEIIDELTSRGILSGFWYEVHLEIKKL